MANGDPNEPIKVHVESLRDITLDLKNGVGKLTDAVLKVHDDLLILPGILSKEYSETISRQWRDMERLFSNLSVAVQDYHEETREQIHTCSENLIAADKENHKTVIAKIEEKHRATDKWLEWLKVGSILLVGLAAIISSLIQIFLK